MKILVRVKQESVCLKVSGVELSINLQEIVKDTKTLESYIDIFKTVMKPIIPDYLFEDMKSSGVQYDRIINAITLAADYLQLMEGLDATSTIELTDDCKIKIGGIVSENGITIDFVSLMQLYTKIIKMFSPETFEDKNEVEFEKVYDTRDTEESSKYNKHEKITFIPKEENER